MWEFNFSNYWCRKPCAEGRGLEEVGWLALSKPAFTEARSWELKWDQCCRSYLDSNYCHFWSIGSSPHQQTGALPLINGHTHRRAHNLRNTTINTLSLFLFFAFTSANTHTHTHTHKHGEKPSKCVWSMPTRPESRICIISCSVVLIDRRIKWLVKESFMSLLFSFFLAPSLQEFICKEKHLSLDVCFCDLGFARNRYIFKELADWCCHAMWFRNWYIYLFNSQFQLYTLWCTVPKLFRSLF